MGAVPLGAVGTVRVKPPSTAVALGGGGGVRGLIFPTE